MGIEGYGGLCPKCQKAMLSKYESSMCGLLFDACPWCGFADGTQDMMAPISENEIWEAIFENHRVNSFEELIAYLKLEPHVAEKDSDFWPSIFNYQHLVGPFEAPNTQPAD